MIFKYLLHDCKFLFKETDFSQNIKKNKKFSNSKRTKVNSFYLQKIFSKSWYLKAAPFAFQTWMIQCDLVCKFRDHRLSDVHIVWFQLLKVRYWEFCSVHISCYYSPKFCYGSEVCRQRQNTSLLMKNDHWYRKWCKTNLWTTNCFF